MTTKVKIELVQENMPVVVEILANDGSLRYTQTLRIIGNAVEDYVHSGQALRVREMTAQEAHDDGLREQAIKRASAPEA